MLTLDSMLTFVLILLPAMQCIDTVTMLIGLGPALAVIHEHSSQPAEIAYALKSLFHHQFREYHSPLYVEPRPQHLWKSYMLNSWSDETFKESFRVD